MNTQPMLCPVRSGGRVFPLLSSGLLVAMAAAIVLAGCGGGSVLEVSLGKEGETNLVSPPSNIQIPELAGLSRYAYVITTTSSQGIYRFDLDGRSPYPFVYLDLSGKISEGVPDELLIHDEEHGLFTTSGGRDGKGEGIHLFDPTPPSPENFALQASVPVFPVLFDSAMLDSDGESVNGIDPSDAYTSGVAVSNGKIYVCTSNFSRVGKYPVCSPGTVLIYQWDPAKDPPTVSRSDPPFIVTTSYNPTEVTALGERTVLVTNSGVLAIDEARAVPLTEASVDVIDTVLDCVVATYPLGLAALSYKTIGITPDRTRALVGSVAYNSVYELDLTVLDDAPQSCPNPVPRLESAVLAGPQDPIRVGQAGVAGVETNDFVVQVAVSSDGTRAYASGYNSGTLSVLEVEQEPGSPSPKRPLLVLSLTPPLPTQEDAGPGPLAVRPGIPGTDFSGPDLFVLIGLPIGKMFNVQTY